MMLDHAQIVENNPYDAVSHFPDEHRSVFPMVFPSVIASLRHHPESSPSLPPVQPNNRLSETAGLALGLEEAEDVVLTD